MKGHASTTTTVTDSVKMTLLHQRCRCGDQPRMNADKAVSQLPSRRSLIRLAPQAFTVVHRAKQPRRQTPRLSSAEQLLLFEWVATG
jgi:hypothetical protein